MAKRRKVELPVELDEEQAELIGPIGVEGFNDRKSGQLYPKYPDDQAYMRGFNAFANIKVKQRNQALLRYRRDY